MSFLRTEFDTIIDDAIQTTLGTFNLYHFKMVEFVKTCYIIYST